MRWLQSLNRLSVSWKAYQVNRVLQLQEPAAYRDAVLLLAFAALWAVITTGADTKSDKAWAGLHSMLDCPAAATPFALGNGSI